MTRELVPLPLHFDALQCQRDNFLHPHFRPLKQWKCKRNRIHCCLESSIENDETSLKLDRKEQDGETNEKKIKMFEVRTLEERARASFLEV